MDAQHKLFSRTSFAILNFKFIYDIIFNGAYGVGAAAMVGASPSPLGGRDRSVSEPR